MNILHLLIHVFLKKTHTHTQNLLTVLIGGFVKIICLFLHLILIFSLIHSFNKHLLNTFYAKCPCNATIYQWSKGPENFLL